MEKMVPPWKHSSQSPKEVNIVYKKRAFFAVGEGVGLIRTSNTTHLFKTLSVKSFSRAKPVAKDAQKTNSDPTTRSKGRKFHVEHDVRYSTILIGPRTLEAREEIGPAKSCVRNLSRSYPVATFCFLSREASSPPAANQNTVNHWWS